MKVLLIIVGKTDFKYLEEGIQLYSNRIVHYLPFEIITIKDLKKAKSLSPELVKENEGKEILNKIEPTDFVILLDENGKEFTSVQFAKYIENKTITGIRKLIFVIGGAYGYSDNVYKRANDKFSLSKMTFSHQIVRLIFMEQLYRAFTIIKGEPYHHE
jgi:23S rRNA (pseudouridine1915-N3)-methyltransferase